MQMGPRGGADYWRIRIPPRRNGRRRNGSLRVLLQYYEESFRNEDWKRYGRFFIITVNKRNGAHVFSLGNYKTALKSGMFEMNS